MSHNKHNFITNFVGISFYSEKEITFLWLLSVFYKEMWFITEQDKRFFYLPKHPHQPQETPQSLTRWLFGEWPFPCPSSGHSIMLTTHLPLLPRLRMALAVSPLPIRVHSMHRDFATHTDSRKEIVFMKHVQVLWHKLLLTMNLVLRGHSSHNASMLAAVQLEVLKYGIHKNTYYNIQQKKKTSTHPATCQNP